MQPSIPLAVNSLIQNNQGQLSTFPFPENFAATIPQEIRKQIVQWMLTNYIWPQIQSRQSNEAQWDRTLNMARAALKLTDMRVSEESRLAASIKQKALEGNLTPGLRADLSDTVIYDAIDRLTNLNHFISFKERLPVQYNLPSNVEYPNETDVYSPSHRLVKSANALLKFCADGTDFYRKHWMTARHHYTYGISYATSEFEQVIENVTRRSAQDPKQFEDRLELTKFGVTFEPLSLRKLWLNTTLTPYNMEYQPCPFFFEEIPRFAIVANKYEPDLNPFGYVNLESLPSGQWLMSSTETNSWREALQQANPDSTLPTISDPTKGIEAKWVLYPMLPLQLIEADQSTLEKYQREPEVLAFIQRTGHIWQFDVDGRKMIPMQRFIMEIFGTSLVGGNVEIIRMQPNFYPKNNIPIYGSAHMPDLDSGQYSPSIATILECHYIQITKALNQFLDNKDLQNDPPSKVQINSPCIDADLNKPGAKNRVNSMNDYEKDTIIDGTGTTPSFIQAAREQAQTTSKAGDAIVGKAMGSRTTATEATNAFETSMSGITTDINLFNHDIAGGYATRVWDYLGVWADPDVLHRITGSFGFALKPEHFAVRLDVTWDIGSTYIESFNRQQNIRYMLEASLGDPSINRAYLWRALLREWRFPDVDRIINDGGYEQQILEACNQAERTYMGGGALVLIDPDQNHQIAKRVKVAYLKDRDSVWNTRPEYAVNAVALVDQIRIHESYIMLQMYQQLAMLQGEGDQTADLPSLQQLQSSGQMPAPPHAIQNIGQAAQMNGAALT